MASYGGLAADDIPKNSAECDAALAETVMHTVFDDQRMNDKREFFAVPVQHAIEVLDMLADVMHGGRTH